MFSGDTKTSKNSFEKGEGGLLDTSSKSRQLAEGLSNPALSPNCLKEKESNTTIKKAYKTTLFFALCRVYSVILSRWGGGGKIDLVKRAIPSKNDLSSKTNATSTADPFILSLLNVLSFSTSCLKTSWVLLQSDSTVISDLNSLLDEKNR